MRKPLLPLIVLALLATLGLAACGSSSSSDTTTAASAPPPAQRPQSRAQHSEKPSQGEAKKHIQPKPAAGNKVPGDTSASFKPRPHHDSGGGSAAFEQKGGDNSIQRYGSEPSSAQFKAAAKALHAYLEARAAHAWAAACSYLQAGVAAGLGQVGSGGSASCPKLLAGLSAGLPARALRESAVADVGALRAEGDHGFVLFTGAHGQRFFMPMAHEGGEWKVAALAPSALP